jgi:ribosome biogenesis GTPase A
MEEKNEKIKDKVIKRRMSREPMIRLKVMLLGNSQVGKSSILWK